MKRPSSAKQVRSNWTQLQPDSHQPHRFSSNYIRLQGSKLVSNKEVNRLLPKRIHYDKEKLYCETLQLKTALNDMSDENHKLKTRVAILEKEKDRMLKTEQPGTKPGARSGTMGLSVEKQNAIVANLKKMVRESRQEAQAAKGELAKLKKTVRFTKFNQLQLENQVLTEQNKRISKMILHLQAELERSQGQHQLVGEMERQLRDRREEVLAKAEALERYEEVIEQLSLKNRELSERIVVAEKKYQRDLAVQKRKVDQLTRANQGLKSDKRAIQANIQRDRSYIRQPKKAGRTNNSHPHSHVSQPSPTRHQTAQREKEEALQIHSKLKRELQEARDKLAASQSRLKEHEGFSNSREPFQLILTKKDEDSEQLEELQKKKKAPTIQAISKPNISQEKTQQSGVLKDIRDILTYRMKYNRYTFEELKSDIEASPLTSFTSQDLLAMLTEEPFSLTTHYANQFLNNCYRANNRTSNEQLSSAELLQALRQAIGEFELFPEEEEEQVLYQIADAITRLRDLLQRRFDGLKQPEGLVSKEQMEEILSSQTELSQSAIDLAICYVVVNAQSLQKISYQQLLDKFLIGNESEASGPGSKALGFNSESQIAGDQPNGMQGL